MHLWLKVFGWTSTQVPASHLTLQDVLTQPSLASALQHVYQPRSASHRVWVSMRIGRWSKAFVLMTGAPVPKNYVTCAEYTGFTSTTFALVIWRQYCARLEPTTESIPKRC